ncbi:5-methyltetrahydropteroyltriglutamate--homocysteine S-methyltransferase [Herpetosiphon giganteus]|uniref:5-methyltetrahydropteroyltriglutamate-- homocysteine S-methyltransferase n=1 Tax=Herpetosiphon giganteus TaxID=2029754 RepID=UPI00195705F7|nr:5-methyltetrahydropteroyltriglutamate--homocysteine S-methyltransferase [Herpetosiphon giganteus]MBM7842777.1 5-methyltetrahydropteroyltriglutamate--homocysteine methyltransferase [Herpetosiphon giganteus]
MNFQTTVVGYPRVGVGRPYKQALERFWSGKLTEADFRAAIDELRQDRLAIQAQRLDLVPVGDFSLYDHVLDTALMLGAVPARFGKLDTNNLQGYFAMARGRDGVPALEMTKWFDTNYHYLVPEIPERWELQANLVLEQLRFAQNTLGSKARPVLLGPWTFLRLARLAGAELSKHLQQLIPIYAQIVRELSACDVAYIQCDEPALVGDVTEEEWQAFAACYRELSKHGKLVVQTYYGDATPWYRELCRLPLHGLGLDLVQGQANWAAIQYHGFPQDKILVAGVVNGRNVWRSDLADLQAKISGLSEFVAPERLILSSSCSLLHLPETVTAERNLPVAVSSGLAFAQERLAELELLAQALRNGVASVQASWDAALASRQQWLDGAGRIVPAVRERSAALGAATPARLVYAERVALQQAKLNLPVLPTTTIGSFPQTAALRKARAEAKRNPAGYAETIRAEIAHVIALQEQWELDVLVHGEPERNDMVQFFAEHLAGYIATQEGWVQSYGSRCVRPPVIAGDVYRTAALSVAETAYAQSLTKRPVKGMLTGPVTMLQWSFVRDDLPRSEVAAQIGLALRDEVADLEAAGINIIQIDEPAFREGLPLRRNEWQAYLDWAVRAFRIATSEAAASTQIHTHMCYSDFNDIIDAIAALDADVISIEDARSAGSLLAGLEGRYQQQIGPGVYDIHSPNIPSVEQLVARIQQLLKYLPAEQLWINPDCGLKTRTYAEVEAALRAMLAATKQVRATIH